MNAPTASARYATEVADACTIAVSSVVETWRLFRPADRPHHALPIVGVSFIGGDAHSWYGFHLEAATRLFGDSAPLIVLSRLAHDRVMTSGEPVIQGTIRILLSKTGGGARRQHDAWNKIWAVSLGEFAGRLERRDHHA